MNDHEQGPFEPIAIVGRSCILPDAPDIGAFWESLISGRVSISELPENRWSVDDFWFEAGPGTVPEGKTYAKIGGFVEGFEFDWRRYRIPPNSLSQIDPCQLWAVAVSAAALEDAGYLVDGGHELPSSRTGVIFANALGGENRNTSNIRIWADSFARLAVEHGLPEEASDAFIESITEGTPRVDENTMPGELANVVAGRVANLLDLNGPNYTTDAACATTMAALLDASHMLHARQVDVMVCGASDRTMDPGTFAKFSAIGALSATHSRPFDASADGFVMGEGAGALVLKRLEDAISAGDTIHGVIRGIGASSDGRGKGITAPSELGQSRAINRALHQAGWTADMIDHVEAHGTSTKVGDATELSVLANIHAGRAIPVGVGSIKSQIGHLKSAAGMAGLLKILLCMEHDTITPSAGFEDPNPTVDWNDLPLEIVTTPKEWSPLGEDSLLRAQISSFGFGGTNWVVLVESFDAAHHSPIAQQWVAARDASTRVLLGDSVTSLPDVASILDSTATPSLSHDALKEIEGGLLLLSADDPSSLSSLLGTVTKDLLDPSKGPTFDDDPCGRRLSQALTESSHSFGIDGIRLALVATSWAEFEKKSELAQSRLSKSAMWPMLAAQGIIISIDSPLVEGLVAHMYPGQGSQWVGMTRQLSSRFQSAADVWIRADKTMVDILGGVTLSEFVLRSKLSKEELDEAEELLKRTEYTQPAMLTADLAIDAVLGDYGQIPDMVAGHSLGEYAALMRSSILTMHDALRAAAARGTEMGSIDVPDAGLMASVTAPYDSVLEVIESLDGYVIAANENSPVMTVIAGETESVKQAVAEFTKRGAPCIILQTSHAFHSRIVAPASAPLHRFLDDLEMGLPELPITANFDGEFYPREGEGRAQEHILPQLAPQMASPVKWTTQIQRMYESGARLFVEVGPKRALTTFAGQILEGSPHLAVMTNHPKQGDLASLLAAIGTLAVAGRPIHLPSGDSEIHTEAFRAGPLEAHEDGLEAPSNPVLSKVGAMTTVSDRKNNSSETWVRSVLAGISGYPTNQIAGAISLTTDLGLTDTLAASAIEQISRAPTNSEVSVTISSTVADLFAWVKSAPSGWSIQSAVQVPATPTSVPQISVPSPSRYQSSIVITGVGIGLPGREQVFDDDGIDAILSGTNMIEPIPDDIKQVLLDKRIQRLVKSEDGTGRFEPAETFEDIPQLAGQLKHFDLTDWGVDPKYIKALDTTTELAIAGAYEALEDAGLPLFPIEQESRSGKRTVRGWNLHESIRDRTGVIFASCFPGFNQTIDKVADGGASGDGHFDRLYLFQVLTMGHSQVAQILGARGPNMHTNNACASGASAFAVAEDWLSTGRCDRVIITTADNVTSSTALPWIGSGFAASGAASTSSVVEEAALPFDARRSGLILGAGAASFVLERASDAAARGVEPYVELLGAEIANSAFHGTRLDVDHVSELVANFTRKMATRVNSTPHAIAPRTLFMSHETYTPKRGGSADAEIRALREAFGPAANQVLIGNTKGYTGHPQGPELEGVVAVRGLVEGRIPAIANFRDPDPDLGDLNLSRGESVELDFALRFAAGFGSQIAMTFMRKIADGLDRIDPIRHRAWLEQVTGTSDLHLRRFKRRLVAWVDADENLIDEVEGTHWPPEERLRTVETTPASSSPVHESVVAVPASNLSATASPSVKSEVTPHSTPMPLPAPSSSGSEIHEVLLEVVVEATGYPAEFIEFDQDLEGELGIDTVKQAEIMAEVRARLSLPVDESFSLADHPTLDHLVSYASNILGITSVPASVSESPSVAEEFSEASVVEVAEDAPEAVVPIPSLGSAVDDIREVLLEVVVEATGYPAEFIEFDQDLEGELGIDTVKQAEIMAEVRSRLSLPIDESFSLAEHPTLGHMVGYAAQLLGRIGDDDEDVSPSESTSIPEPLPVPEIPPDSNLESLKVAEASDFESLMGHWAVETEPIPLGRGSVELPEEGTVIVTDDPFGLTPVLSERFEASGLNVVHLYLDATAQSLRDESERDRSIFRLDPADEGQWNTLSSEMEAHPSVVGIVHAAPLHLVGMPWPGRGDSSDHRNKILMAGVRLLNAHRDMATRQGAFVVNIGTIDGKHGAETEQSVHPLMASSAGLFGSWLREHPEVNGHVIDAHPSTLLDPGRLGRVLVDLMRREDLPVEVGITEDHSLVRSVLVPIQLLGQRTWDLEDGDIVLISGGGSGVTAASAIGLAKALKGNHLTFALLGRTPLDDEVASWVDEEEDEIEARRVSLRQQLIDDSDSGKVTIVEWNEAWRPFARSFDIHRTLTDLRSYGHDAVYGSVDVTDAEAVTDFVENQITGKNAVKAIIHGAGIEESRLLHEKSLVTFDNVVRIKLDGLASLISAAPSATRIVCFSSVAGRMFNAGQTDYSAANRALDQAMENLSSDGGLSLAWTGWRGAGMATRGSIERVFEEAGLEMLDLDAGVELFVHAFRSGASGRLAICGRLGMMDQDVAIRRHGIPPLPRAHMISRMIDRTPERMSGEVLLDTGVHQYLSDHAIDGQPVMPGVFAIESMAQMATCVLTTDAVTSVEDAEFGLAIKLINATKPIEVSATPIADDAAMTTIESRLVSKSGAVMDKPISHHKGLIRSVPIDQDAVQRIVEAVGTEQVGDSAEGGIPFYSEGLMFHGPSFQVVGRVLCSTSSRLSLEMTRRADRPSPFAEQVSERPMLTQPFTLEAIFQGAGLLSMAHDGWSCLPVGVERAWICHAQPTESSPLIVHVLRTAIEEHDVLHDAIAVDAGGRVVYAAEGVRLRHFTELPNRLAL